MRVYACKRMLTYDACYCVNRHYFWAVREGFLVGGVGFGHVGLVEGRESRLPSRGTIVGKDGSKKTQGVFGDLTNRSQLLLS